jgi:protein involved in polysaccharide export with SLBB domain
MTFAGGAAVFAILLVVLTSPGADGPEKSDAAQIRAGDRLFVHVFDALPDRPIKGVYPVELSGKVPLGAYGRVHVAGLTPEGAEVRVRDHLKQIIKNPVVSLTWYDPIAHGEGRGEPALRDRITKLEKELIELREAVEKLRKP